MANPLPKTLLNKSHRPTESFVFTKIPVGLGCLSDYLWLRLVTATTTAAAKATATASAATTTSAAAATIFAGLGFVDGEGAAADFLAIQTLDRRLRGFFGIQFDKGEAA